ncbi:MAG: 5'-nucleotidase [Candidatus Acidiferrum sp.]
MPIDLSKLFVVGISSTALFDLEEESRIFSSGGLSAFSKYQLDHEDVVLRPGSAFLLMKALLDINGLLKRPRVEVILLSRNHPDVSLRVFHSIDHYKLEITRAALTGGDSLAPYLSAFKTKLFLSRSVEDVQLAANQGIAASLIYSPPPEIESAPAQIRIAFDGDRVLFSDEAQKVYEERGLAAYHEYERINARKALPAGPFADLLKLLAEIQGDDPNRSPVRIALVTDRNGPAHERAIRTLRDWGVRVDVGLFLGGAPKAEFLKAFGAHIFFDDKPEYCESAAKQVPTGQVFQRIPADTEVGVSLDTVEDTSSREQFLLVCRGYLRKDYQQAEGEFVEWYQANVEGWPSERQSAFMQELNTSIENTPAGKERVAAGSENSDKAKLLDFLEKLVSKHRPR